MHQYEYIVMDTMTKLIILRFPIWANCETIANMEAYCKCKAELRLLWKADPTEHMDKYNIYLTHVDGTKQSTRENNTPPEATQDEPEGALGKVVYTNHFKGKRA